MNENINIAKIIGKYQFDISKRDVMVRMDLQKRKEDIQVLKRVVVDLHLLLLKTFSYHKNIDSHVAEELYTVTGKQYAEMSKSINDVLERIRNLQFNVPVSNNRFLQVARRNPINYEELVNIDLEDLVIGNELFIEKIKDAIQVISAIKDRVTTSILLKIIDKHEGYIIMLKEKFIYSY